MSASKTPAAYVDSVCTAATAWRDAVQSASAQLNSGSSAASSLTEAKSQYVTFVAALVSATGQADSQLSAAGVPAVPKGSKIASTLVGIFADAKSSLARDASQAAAVPTTDSAAFQAAAHQVVVGIQGSLAGMKNASPAKNPELHSAAAKDPTCRALANQRNSSTASTTPSTTTSPSSRSSSPLALGQSADFAGEEPIGAGAGEGVSVTVQGVIDPDTHVVGLGGPSMPAPPPSGEHYVAVELTLRSIGTAAWGGDPSMDTSLISKSTGGPVGQADPSLAGPGQCATDLSAGSTNLAPGETERGCVFFDVPTGQQISAVQYQTQGGQGGNLATWAVSH